MASSFLPRHTRSEEQRPDGITLSAPDTIESDELSSVLASRGDESRRLKIETLSRLEPGGADADTREERKSLLCLTETSQTKVEASLRAETVIKEKKHTLTKLFQAQISELFGVVPPSKFLL